LLLEPTDQVGASWRTRYDGLDIHAARGTRLAQHNSQPGAEVIEHAPVPRWGWGEAPPFEP
jgi:hypothetical protein